MKIFKLQATTQKSYYGKAIVIEDNQGNKILQSYATQVAKIDKNGNLQKLWNGYSQTTMHHIIDFCKLYNVNFAGTKKAWEQLDNTATTQERYKIEFSNGFVNWTPNTIFDNYEDAEEYADKIAQECNYTIGYAINRII